MRLFSSMAAMVIAAGISGNNAANGSGEPKDFGLKEIGPKPEGESPRWIQQALLAGRRGKGTRKQRKKLNSLHSARMAVLLKDIGTLHE